MKTEEEEEQFAIARLIIIGDPLSVYELDKLERVITNELGRAMIIPPYNQMISFKTQKPK